MDEAAAQPANWSPLLKLVQNAQVDAQVMPRPPSTASDLPEPDDDVPLYAARRHIYPQRVHGTYRRIKWIVLYLTLGI